MVQMQTWCRGRSVQGCNTIWGSWWHRLLQDLML